MAALYTDSSKKKSKAIPVTGHGDLQGCEMLRISHYLDNRLTDGGKVVSPTHGPHFTPQKYSYFYVSGTQRKENVHRWKSLPEDW
jgi:hypothetical protein